MKPVEKIQEILDSKNIKASKMMKDLGFSSGLFSQWKAGKQQVSLEKIVSIATYFDCSVDYLLGRTDNPQGISQINNHNDNLNKISQINQTVLQIAMAYAQVEYKAELEAGELTPDIIVPIELKRMDRFSDIVIDAYDYYNNYCDKMKCLLHQEENNKD